MIKALYSSAAGMQSQQTQVDVIANNLANVNTAGFKKSQAHFEDLFYEKPRPPGGATGEGSTLAGLEVGSGSRLVNTTKVFTPGVVWQTGRDLDLAIGGDGFFEIEGPGGQRAFTRDGHFLRDANGSMVTAQGFRVVPQITMPPEASTVTVSPDGVVSFASNGTNQELGQITLVRFVNPSGLESLGGNIYASTANSGDAVPANPGELGVGQILQGSQERSNVDIATELIALIIAQRAFEVNSRSISTADDMLRNANDITR